jgi:hypothetical protein
MTQVIAVPDVNLHTGSVIQRYFAFILNGASGTLALNSSVDGGGTWTWQTLSGSPPAGVLSIAAATSFFGGNLATDGTAINQIYSFVVGNDQHLWVVVSLDNGTTWSWQDQGAAPTAIAGAPDAVSRESVESPSALELDTYCYVIGTDGHLYVNYSQDNGTTWNWADRGTPPATTLAAGQPSVLSYFDGTHQSIYAFAIGNDNSLYANSGDGSTWNWQSLGQPSGVGVSSVANFRPTALTIPPDAAKEIYVFVIGTNGHLFACYSPSGGIGWTWEDLGVPPGTGIQSFFQNALRVGIESKSAAFTWPVFVFAVGDDFNLYMTSSSDASLGPSATWNWQPLGQPPGRGLLGLNGAVASTEVEASLAAYQMYIFASDFDSDLHTIRWNGSTWTWFDQNGPP